MRMLTAGKMLLKIISEFKVTFFHNLANLTLTPSTGCTETYVQLTWTGRKLESRKSDMQTFDMTCL